MFISLKDQLDQPHIVELLEYAVFSDEAELEKVAEQYKEDERLFLLGYLEGDEIIGTIGYEMVSDRTIRIRHLAVDPQYRGLGYGRGIILELLEKERPVKIKAEVDEAAADFFRNIGFEITSLGEQFPYGEKFECSFITEFV